jgi:Zn-dependent protease/CBS domain-containing protein
MTQPSARGEDDRGHGVRIGSVGGVPVYLAPSWFVIAVVIVAIVASPHLETRPLFGIGLGAIQAGMLLASVLVHEAAHALTAKAVGIPVVRIVATLWGGHTSMEADRGTPGRTAAVAAAGPGANALLALVAWLVMPGLHDDHAHAIAFGLVVINASLAVLNFLPGLPLDGGHVVESLVWKATGDRNRGMVVAGWAGRVVTVLVVGWFLVRPLLRGDGLGLESLWVLIIGSVMWAGAGQAIQRGQVMGRIGRVRLGDVLRPAALVPPTTSIAEAVGTGSRELVVTDPRGLPAAYVDVAHLMAVPEAARASTPVSAVASRQHPSWVVEADPAGDVLPTLAAMQEHGFTIAAVVHHRRLVGVVHATDIGQAMGRA